MAGVDLYGHPLTAGAEASAAYNRGIGALLRLGEGAVPEVAVSIEHDPTFALGHAALAVLGHEMCAPIDVEARVRDAQRYTERCTDRERSHVDAVARHIHGDSAPLVQHLRVYPTDALLLSVAVPTIAFAGVTQVPEDAWAIVERCAPAYGDDWFYVGLLGFIRQEQGRFEEAMELSRRSLAQQPAAGHSAHARAHAHYETGDHEAGLDWMDGWLAGPGATVDNQSHFSWHAAMHELSMGNLEAVRRRYQTQLRPEPDRGARALVDSGSLVWRWMITPGAADVPDIDEVLSVTEHDLLSTPPTAFIALHAAVALCAAEDADGLSTLARCCSRRSDSTQSQVAAPLAKALRLLVLGRASDAADELGYLQSKIWRLGGSDAQREVVEETRIIALLRAGRQPEALALLDRRLDRRACRRDEWFRAVAQLAEMSPVLTETLLGKTSADAD